MRHLRVVFALVLAVVISGCVGNPTNSPTPTATKRTYNGTASVGDFLNITIDTTAQTITYSNLSNGQSGVIPYTVNANGSYALNDPTGNLISAYEIPGYAMVIQAAKAGPNMNTPALITAVESGPITLASFSNSSYNYMQFRTSSGGMGVGSVSIAGTTGQSSSYWPYGALNSGAGSPFTGSSLSFGGMTEATSGTYIYGPDGGGGDDYIFGTTSGFFIVDTGNGSILGLQKAATKAFDPTTAGSYSAIYYQKVNATNGQNNVETGTPSLGQATFVVTASGGVTVTDSQSNVLAQGTLTPIADTSYLYGSAGQLADPCYGMFTFRVTKGSSQEDVFVTFVKNAVVFSTFSANLPWSPGSGTYNYQYGVGLK